MSVKKSAKHDIVQVKNPRTDRYVKIDRTAGLIVAHKKSEGPYKGVRVIRNQK
jgi:polynucleotide 5'-kinase involved in rRNA processing